MMSAGRSGACFQAPGGESAGNSLRALTHQPQACHSSPVSFPTTPGLSLVLPEVGVGGWGGSAMILKQALQNPGLFLEATKRDSRKKRKAWFSFPQTSPFELQEPENHPPLTGCEKQTKSSPSLAVQKPERDRPWWQGPLKARLRPRPTHCPATPGRLHARALRGSAPWKPARALSAVGPWASHLSGSVLPVVRWA